MAACGNIAPFLIASGKEVLTFCLKPLDDDAFTDTNGVRHWLCNRNWFSVGTDYLVTKNGSVDKKVIVKVVQHINQHARKTVSPHEHILLLVDGHSSRQWEAWLQECGKHRILVMKLPANTTHLPQPCDQSVNKIFRKHSG